MRNYLEVFNDIEKLLLEQYGEGPPLRPWSEFERMYDNLVSEMLNSVRVLESHVG